MTPGDCATQSTTTSLRVSNSSLPSAFSWWGFDPEIDTGQLASFRSKFNVNLATRIFGPWSGKLLNSGEEIELKYPGSADATLSFFVPYYTMEEIDYRDQAPWPPEADGLGSSLQRISLTDFANDPQNWSAVTPQSFTLQDSDNDGMDDLWELLHGLVVGVDDGGLDPDHDNQSNLEEYKAGTSPRDARSYLDLEVSETPTGLSLGLYSRPGNFLHHRAQRLTPAADHVDGIAGDQS